MVRKAGQMEEASWEVHNKEAKTVQEAIRYYVRVLRVIIN
jgi:hypothetical protein